MKTLYKFVLASGFAVGAAALLSGCVISPTPAYSGEQRFQHIGINWMNEWEQIGDDTDNMLLLRPQGQLSGWDTVHRD
jgi:hypothetical protein